MRDCHFQVSGELIGCLKRLGRPSLELRIMSRGLSGHCFNHREPFNFAISMINLMIFCPTHTIRIRTECVSLRLCSRTACLEQSGLVIRRPGLHSPFQIVLEVSPISRPDRPNLMHPKKLILAYEQGNFSRMIDCITSHFVSPS